MSRPAPHLQSYILRQTAEVELPGARTAAEITEVFNAAHKAALHDTNAGQQAARIGIAPVAKLADGKRLYAAKDIPAIEKGLLKLLRSRQKYGHEDGSFKKSDK